MLNKKPYVNDTQFYGCSIFNFCSFWIENSTEQAVVCVLGVRKLNFEHMKGRIKEWDGFSLIKWVSYIKHFYWWWVPDVWLLSTSQLMAIRGNAIPISLLTIEGPAPLPHSGRQTFQVIGLSMDYFKEMLTFSEA